MRKAIEQEGMLILGSGQKIVRTEIIDDGQGIRYYYTVPESESKTVPKSKSKTVPESESKTVPESESKTVPESESKTVPKSKSKTVPESESKTVPESESKTVPESESKTVPKSKSKTVPKSKSKTVPESESKTVPKSKSKKVQLQAGSKEFEEMFPIVDIENVSLQDSFMSYEPENNLEKRVKSNIIRAKELGMKNFRKPCMDPSFADDGKTIIYCAGKKPAVGQSAVWWNENAPKFMPEKNSRQINDLEKDVFLGIIIKYLVYEEEKKVKDAWKAVCVNSKDIGHYYNSKNPKRDFEMTGSRKVGKWYDLGNIHKIVKRHGALGFVRFGGDYNDVGSFSPLASVYTIDDSNYRYKYSVGELVLDV